MRLWFQYLNDGVCKQMQANASAYCGMSLEAHRHLDSIAECSIFRSTQDNVTFFAAALSTLINIPWLGLDASS